MPPTKLPTSTNPVQSMSWAPSGPGAFAFNLLDITPAGIEDVFIDGDQSKGIPSGLLTSVPSVTRDPQTQNLLENAVGHYAEYKGAQQPTTITVEAAVELAELSHETINILQPGLTRSDWMSDTRATLAVGTGNSKFAVTARVAGTAGNAYSLTMTVPATANSPLSVSVSGSAITVSLATGATASVSISTARDVVRAINDHTAANLLVQAGLSGVGNTGNGVVGALAATSLAGGAAGARVGYQYNDSGRFNETDYLDNVAMVLPTTFDAVYYVCIIKNAINVGEWNPSYDENGAVAGVGVTFRGHVTSADRNPVTGAIASPLTQYLLDASVQV